MITYNHEQFIAEAIESALGQRTNFDYEIVIGEDCSTDATGRIVDDYARRFPQRIRIIRGEVNVGARKNSQRTLQACRGKYVAILEGDDRWTCADKLQKQVDFLDAHPDHSMVFHDVRFVEKYGDQRTWTGGDASAMAAAGVESLIYRNFVGTASIMFRRHLAEHLWSPKELDFGDWPLLVMLATKGKMGFLPDVMADYRLHTGGVYSTRDDEWKVRASLRFYPYLEQYLGPQYRDRVRRTWYGHLYKLALDTCNVRGPHAARGYARECLLFRPLWINPRQRLKIMLMTHVPCLFNAVAVMVGYPQIPSLGLKQREKV
jgi:glycosyltransferase involved in cell wall biosynthesis